MDSESSRFQDARHSRRLTLGQVAQMTGYSVGTISGVENGHDQPSSRLRAKLIEALNLNPDWLRTGKGLMFATDQLGKPVAVADQKPETNSYGEPLKPFALLDAKDFNVDLDHLIFSIDSIELEKAYGFFSRMAELKGATGVIAGEVAMMLAIELRDREQRQKKKKGKKG